MFSPESRRDGSFLERVVDRVRGAEELLQNDVHPAEHFCKEEVFAGFIKGRFLAFVPSFLASETETLGRGPRGGCKTLCGGRKGGDGGENCTAYEDSRGRAE